MSSGIYSPRAKNEAGRSFLHRGLQWGPGKAQQSGARRAEFVVVYGHRKAGTQSVGCFPGDGWRAGDRQLGECRAKSEPIAAELAGSPKSHLFASPDLSHSYLKKSFHSHSSKSFAYPSWFFSQTARKQGTAYQENEGHGRGGNEGSRVHKSRSSVKNPSRAESRM